MDLRYFELHDLLCDALIALEAGDQAGAAALVRKALAWTEADWLATPSSLPAADQLSLVSSDQGDDDEE